MSETITPKSAAIALCCSVDQVRNLISAGELKAVNIGLGAQRARYVIDAEELEAFKVRRATSNVHRKELASRG
jgi:hypothetical protein